MQNGAKEEPGEAAPPEAVAGDEAQQAAEDFVCEERLTEACALSPVAPARTRCLPTDVHCLVDRLSTGTYACARNKLMLPQPCCEPWYLSELCLKEFAGCAAVQRCLLLPWL